MIRKLLYSKNNTYASVKINASTVRYIIEVEEKISNLKQVVEKGEYSYEGNYSAVFTPLKTKIPENTKCRLIIPYRFTIIKSLKYNEPLYEQDILNLLRLNSEHYFMLPFADVYADFEYLSSQKTHLRIAAAKKKEIDEYILSFNRLGLALSRINIDILILEKILIEKLSSRSNKACMIFLIHQLEMLQLIFTERRLYFYKTIQLQNKSCAEAEIERFWQFIHASQFKIGKISHLIILGAHSCHALCANLKNNYPCDINCQYTLESYEKEYSGLGYLFRIGLEHDA